MYLVLSYLSIVERHGYSISEKKERYLLFYKIKRWFNQEEVFFYDAEVYEFEFLEEKMERPKMRRDSWGKRSRNYAIVSGQR